MRFLWFLLALGCLASIGHGEEYGDEEYLKKQEDLLVGLKYLHQPDWNVEIFELIKNYQIWHDYDNFNNVEKVKNFVNLYKGKRLLQQSEEFNIHNDAHLEEAKALFDVWYNAKDYKTLMTAGYWSRTVVNSDLYFYVVSLIQAHREDLKTFIMPPPYEVNPHLFINGEVIKKAQRLKMQGFYGIEKKDGIYEVTIPMNYTGWYMHMNPEQKLAYFTEDVEYNAFYYNFNLDYPHWMEGKPYGLDKDRRGDVYISFHHQLTARYYLERLSNDLGHIPAFNWREPIKSGYYSPLMLHTAKQFNTRPNFYNLYTEGNHKFIQEAEDRERRLRDIVDKGFFMFNGKKVPVADPDDVNTLGNLIQGNPDVEEFHHNYHDHILPKFIENPATAVRDPLFYQFTKNLMYNYWRFISHLKPYTKEEIGFKGVKVTSARVDKIKTYFEHFDVDISNALLIEPTTEKHDIKEFNSGAVPFKLDEYRIKAGTVRLNHKPFTFTLNVNSEVDQDAIVRVFIGPKYDEYGNFINFHENRKNFVFIDIFKTHLTVGDNVIDHSTNDIKYYGPPLTSYYELYKHLMSAKKGEEKWAPGILQGRCTFPKHLLVPKGKKGGMTYQFFFVINEYKPPKAELRSNFDIRTSCGIGSGTRFFEERPLLFPIDREIDDTVYYQPNMIFSDSLWIFVALGCLASFVSANLEYGGEEYLEYQKNLLLLFKYVHQPYWNADLHAYGVNYKIWEDYDNYNNVGEVKKFVDLVQRRRLLPRQQHFSLHNEDHLEEVKGFYHVLYNAKDLKTLFKAAFWARFNLHERLFMYVLGLVVSHRTDMTEFILPPPQEYCPYQFISAEVIKKAQQIKMQGFYGREKVNGLYEVIIPMNYSGWTMHMNPDQKLTYFTEDVGFNAFYYNFNLDYPHWMEGKPYGLDTDNRGEIFIAAHHWMSARYYLERLSNDLGHIPGFNWREPIKSGYYQPLMTVNGREMKSRPNFYNLYTNTNPRFIEEAEDRERRIRDIVDKGFFTFGNKKVSVSTPEDLDVLGNLLQGNPDVDEFHHNYHDHILPSFLQNPATAARDPLFYQFHNNLMYSYYRFMSHVKPYTKEEILYPGVKITGVKVDKIETYFENFDVDITNAIEVHPEPEHDNEVPSNAIHFKPDEFYIKARTVRLNHKPFTYTMNVHSDVEKDSLIRVFIGPKFDEYGKFIPFEENRKHFLFIDIFPQKLKAGDNVITHSSDDNMYLGKDMTTYYELYRRLMSAQKGEEKWTPGILQGRCTFPRHLLVPKGKKGGMTFQFYFVISDLPQAFTDLMGKYDFTKSCGVGTGRKFSTDKSMMWPIDRQIDDTVFYQPNMYFQDVEIFFTDENAIRWL
ncbi:CLUMA_CG008510, isoform A [Clunio marinus]|uniref:CLUMA_CG008510, isoform A n=1 Tax=Clunio marinus TaxID=568069 RepID=A0A1J1I3Z4_9DIPT|nr:CLUMA_CG008510, isoform A [Clunio marinus]